MEVGEAFLVAEGHIGRLVEATLWVCRRRKSSKPVVVQSVTVFVCLDPPLHPTNNVVFRVAGRYDSPIRLPLMKLVLSEGASCHRSMLIFDRLYPNSGCEVGMSVSQFVYTCPASG